MDRQRLIILICCTLAFLGACWYLFAQTWGESQNRFRVGMPISVSQASKFGLLSQSQMASMSAPTMPDVRATDPLISGTTNSKVTMMVFGDFQSDLTKQEAAAMEQALNIVGPNLIQTVWRDFPDQNSHSRALATAVAVRCAAQQGKFKSMYDLVIKESQQYDDFELLRFARRAGVDEQAYSVCIKDPAIPFGIQQDLADAGNHGITEIPMLFINGTPIKGYTDAPALTAALRDALKQVSH
ncbi:MAG: thioredoxin domain-containing protein [Patescibacteria group bacterium]